MLQPYLLEAKTARNCMYQCHHMRVDAPKDGALFSSSYVKLFLLTFVPLRRLSSYDAKLVLRSTPPCSHEMNPSRPQSVIHHGGLAVCTAAFCSSPLRVCMCLCVGVYIRELNSAKLLCLPAMAALLSVKSHFR